MLIMSVPGEGYSEHTWWRLFWAYLVKVILSIPGEGYFEHTWWRLFQKHVVRTKFDIYYYLVCQWLVARRCFSPGTPVSSTNKTDRHDITEILLKVVLNTIKHKKKLNRVRTKFDIYYFLFLFLSCRIQADCTILYVYLHII
jgi:hypothetical protein